MRRGKSHRGLPGAAQVVLMVPVLLMVLVRQTAAVVREPVIVVDTRVMESPWLRYFADLYNTKPLLFALWVLVLVCVYSTLLTGLLEMLHLCLQRMVNISQRKQR